MSDHGKLDVGNPERPAINRLAPIAFDAAKYHNLPSVTNMDDTSFAALLLTIVHIEGRLEGNGKPKTIKEWVSDDGADIPTVQGIYDGTTGISNVRPSVGLEILMGQIFGPNQELLGTGCYTIRGSSYYDFIEANESGFETIPSIDPLIGMPYVITTEMTIARELQDEKIAIEYLAANLRRGADRVSLLDHEPSAFNLGAYHKAGIQTPGDSGYRAEPEDSDSDDDTDDDADADEIAVIEGTHNHPIYEVTLQNTSTLFRG